MPLTVSKLAAASTLSDGGVANRQSLSGYEKTQRRPIKRAVKTSHVAEHSLRPELTVVPLEAIRKRIREDLGQRRGHAPKNVHKNICRTPSTKRSSAVTGGTCSGPVSRRFSFFQRTELVVSDGSVEMRTIRRREVATTATTKFSSFFHYFGAATAFFGRTFSSAVSRFDPVIRDNPLDGCFPLRLPKWMLISLRQLTKDAANKKC